MAQPGEPIARYDRLVVTLLVPVLAFQALRKVGTIYDSDTWWHLATGRFILDTRTIPRTDPFSWTAAGELWQPKGWLSDVVIAALERVGGLPLVALLRPTFTVLIGVAVFLLARRSGPAHWSAVAAAGLAVFFAEPFVVERPQLFSFVLLPIAVIAARLAVRGSKAALLGIMAICALWANLHGVFAVGVAVIVSTAVGHAIDRRVIKWPFMVAAGAVVGGLVSPLFWKGYANALYVPSVSQTINEWRSLNLADPADWLFLVVPVLGILGMALSGRWRMWEVMLPVVGLTAAAVLAIRNAPLAAVVAAPEVAVGLSSLQLVKLRAWARPRTGPIVTGLWLAGVALAVQSIGGIVNLGQPEPSQFPTGAAEEIPAGCRLLNEYAHGGYLIATRWPEVRVSQDGRNDLYGIERIEMQKRLLDSGTEPGLREEGIDCVLAENHRPLARVLESSPEWVLVSTDEVGSLYVAAR